MQYVPPKNFKKLTGLIIEYGEKQVPAEINVRDLLHTLSCRVHHVFIVHNAPVNRCVLSNWDEDIVLQSSSIQTLPA